MQNGDNNYLSTVALSWMVRQAQIAGVNMDASGIGINMSDNVYVHDQSNAIRFGNPNHAPDWWEVGEPFGAMYSGAEDRSVRGAVSGNRQRSMGFSDASATDGVISMLNADTHRFINYNPRPHDIATDKRRTTNIPQHEGYPGNPNPSNITGTVDMQAYLLWLHDHGYVFAE